MKLLDLVLCRFQFIVIVPALLLSAHPLLLLYRTAAERIFISVFISFQKFLVTWVTTGGLSFVGVPYGAPTYVAGVMMNTAKPLFLICRTMTSSQMQL